MALFDNFKKLHKRQQDPLNNIEIVTETHPEDDQPEPEIPPEQLSPSSAEADFPYKGECNIRSVELENVVINGITIGKIKVDNLSLKFKPVIDCQESDDNESETMSDSARELFESINKSEADELFSSEIPDSDAKDIMSFINRAKGNSQNKGDREADESKE